MRKKASVVSRAGQNERCGQFWEVIKQEVREMRQTVWRVEETEMRTERGIPPS